MLIVACIKQVPDTTQVKVDPVTGTLIREGVPFIMNPYDTHALEESLRLNHKSGEDDHKQGKEAERILGAVPKDHIVKKLEKYLE